MTARQREVLEYIQQCRLEKAYAPSAREIGRHFGIRTPTGVQCHINALVPVDVRSMLTTTPSIVARAGMVKPKSVRISKYDSVSSMLLVETTEQTLFELLTLAELPLQFQKPPFELLLANPRPPLAYGLTDRFRTVALGSRLWPAGRGMKMAEYAWELPICTACVGLGRGAFSEAPVERQGRQSNGSE